ncbi:MAG: serine hydrolase [Chitinophagaceae bacterium]|nr:serine hydrolase [Chitinophagaceae bacterium]
MKKFLVLLLLVLTQKGFSQTDTIPSFVRDSLDVYVNRALHDWQIPGVSVCIVKNGKVVWMKGYGVKETGTNDNVDENTLFMIGSNTKAFTATALAMLDADNLPAGKAGKLSLDDKVQKWLPDFKLYDPWVAKEATIRDLLCHRLGFETFQGDFMYFDSDLTTAEVREKMSKLKPMYGFRSKWGYTNSAFMTAGEIIPKVTDKSWGDFVTKRIFKPLGMNNSLALSKDIKTAGNKCSAHTVVMGELKKIPYGNIDNLAPAGSISSSANDMSKWVLMLLNNGKMDGREIVPASAIAQTRTPHSILGNGGHMFNKSHFSLYGLGWFLEEYAGRKIVAHTGGVNGFVTSVCLVPEEKLGIIVLTNTDANNFYEALRNEIEDAYLGLPYRNYSNVYRSYQWADEEQKAKEYKIIRDSIALNPKTDLPLTAYAGDYMHSVYGKMNIKIETGKLIMRFEHHKGRTGTLEALGGNRFFCTYNDPLYGMKKLDFTVADKKVKSLTVKVADFVEFTPYEFIKTK